MWRDTKTQSVEDLVVSFLVGAYRAAEALKEERAWHQERRRQEEARRLEALARAQEGERRKGLEAQASRWRTSQEVAAFADAAEARASESEMSDAQRQAFGEWLTWARDHAERLAPLSEGLPPPHPKPLGYGRQRIV